MADYNFTNQQALADSIKPKLIALKNALDLRYPFFSKLSFAKKKIYVKSDKDPVVSLAWTTLIQLCNFFDVKVDTDGV